MSQPLGEKLTLHDLQAILGWAEWASIHAYPIDEEVIDKIVRMRDAYNAMS